MTRRVICLCPEDDDGRRAADGGRGSRLCGGIIGVVSAGAGDDWEG